MRAEAERMRDMMIIYFAGLIGIWKGVPIGMMLNTSPLIVGFMTLTGSCTTTIILYLFGDWVKKFIEKRPGWAKMRKKQMKVERLMKKYGVIGLGMIGTITMGPSVTIITGLLLTRAKNKLLMWTIIGILLWTTVITTAAATGLEIIGNITGGDILINRFAG
jgi:membrane protein YqaA with SNARE-associated domain